MKTKTRGARWLGLFLVSALLFLAPACSSPQAYHPVPSWDLPSDALADESAQFVYQVYDNLQDNFYNPDALHHVKLFNAALDGMAKELGRRDVAYEPEYIADDATPGFAKTHFREEMARAAKLGEKAADLTRDTLPFAASAAMLESVHDSHVYFILPEDVDRQSYVGVGITIDRLDADFYYCDAIFTDSPAAKAGLKIFDRLTAVDGLPIGDDMKKLRDQIRGKAGTQVTLTIERLGESKNVVITRGLVSVNPFEMRTLVEGDKRYAYIRIHNFMFNYADLKPLVNFVKSYRDGQGFVLDLRGNPGGYVRNMMSVVQCFAERGTAIYTVEQRGGNRMTYYTSENNKTKARLVVLIDERSASASEIASSCFQEAGRATIVGVNSGGACGEGNLISLNRGAQMMVTMAAVYTPSGRALEKNGVPPDREIKLTCEDIAKAHDTQLEEALRVLSK